MIKTSFNLIFYPVKQDIIRIDIDGVLRNFIDSIYFTLKEKHPKKCPEEKPIITSWDFSKEYPKFNRKKLFNLVFNTYAKEIFYENAKPYADSKSLIYQIRKKFPNLKIILRTHQNKNTVKYTDMWLNKYQIPHDGVFYSDSKINKNLIKNSILIDDKPENIKAIRYGILVTRNWNKSGNFMMRTHNVNDIINYISWLI